MTPSDLQAAAAKEELAAALLHRLADPQKAALLREVDEALDDPFAVARIAAREADLPLVSAAAEQCRLRRAAAARFRQAGRMWFAEPLLQQASGDLLAAHCAARFAGAGHIVDFCCGLGGDTRQLARMAPVRAIDRSLLACTLARLNTLDSPHPVEVVRQEASSPEGDPDRVWIDPDRRAGGLRGGRHLSTLSPGPELLVQWMRRSTGGGLKLGPALDQRELDGLLQHCPAIPEWISSGGRCRQLVVWWGACLPAEAAPGVRIACGAGAGWRCTGVPAPWPAAGGAGDFLLEPDAAVIAAGLVGNLAVALDASPVDPRIALLRLSRPVRAPGRLYRIGGEAPFSRKRLGALLRQYGAGSLVVKVRGSAVEPRELQQALKGVLKQGDPARTVTCILTRIGNRAMMLWGEPIEHGESETEQRDPTER